MKKVILSLSLLGVIAPHTAQGAWGCPLPDGIKNMIAGPATKQAALIAAIGWYYFFWANRQPVDIDENWEWSHVITKLGEDGYCKKVLTGNREVQRDVEFTTVDQDSGLVVTVTESETIVPAYGILGVLDSVFISKLKGFSKLIKYVTRARDFVKDPFAPFKL